MKKLTHSYLACGLLLIMVLSLFTMQIPMTTYAAEISQLTVTFKEPAEGTSATVVPTLSCSQGYEVTWEGYYDFDNTDTEFSGIFEAGHTYLAAINVELAKEDTFADNCNITVNGMKLYGLFDADNVGFFTYTTVTYGEYSGAALTYLFTIPTANGGNGNTEVDNDTNLNETETTGDNTKDITEVPVANGNTTGTTEAPAASGNTTGTTEVPATGGNTAGATETPVAGGETKSTSETLAANNNTTDTTVSAKPTLTVKASKTTLKHSKKKQTVKLTVTTNSRGKISYSTASNSKKRKKYISVSKKGVVTFKKNAPRDTYKVKITVAAKGSFKSVSKVIKIKIK